MSLRYWDFTSPAGPQTVADTIDEDVQRDAGDGFILVPHITPDGPAGFADTVVPILQERGVYRTDSTGSTLRDPVGAHGRARQALPIS